MMRVIETDRLVLRPPRIGDAPAIARLVGDFEVSKWLSVVPHPYRLADAEAFVREIAGPWDRVITREGEVIGVVGIGDSLGYWLGRPFWGQGYMSEAAGGLVGAWFAQSRPGRLRPGLRLPARRTESAPHDTGRAAGATQAHSRPPRQTQASDRITHGRPDETLTSGYFTGNTASAAVLTRLGFTPAGTETAHARAQGRMVEFQRMVLTRAAWEARHG